MPNYNFARNRPRARQVPGYGAVAAAREGLRQGPGFIGRGGGRGAGLGPGMSPVSMGTLGAPDYTMQGQGAAGAPAQSYPRYGGPSYGKGLPDFGPELEDLVLRPPEVVEAEKRRKFRAQLEQEGLLPSAPGETPGAAPGLASLTPELEEIEAGQQAAARPAFRPQPQPQPRIRADVPAGVLRYYQILQQAEPAAPRLREELGRGMYEVGGQVRGPGRFQRTAAPLLAAFAAPLLGPQAASGMLEQTIYGPFMRDVGQHQGALEERKRTLGEAAQLAELEDRLQPKPRDVVVGRSILRTVPGQTPQVIYTQPEPEQTTEGEREFKRELTLWLESEGIPNNSKNELRFRREAWPGILRAKRPDVSVSGYEDFRTSYQDTPQGRKQAALDWLTEQRKIAARFRTDRPSEGEFRLHLFRTDPETYRAIYGSKERDEAPTTGALIQYRNQLVQQLRRSYRLNDQEKAQLHRDLASVDAELRKRGSVGGPPSTNPPPPRTNPYREGPAPRRPLSSFEGK